MSHHEIEELLRAYALDAVDPDEAAEVEEHLAECPRCQAELAEHREVAGLFAYAGQTAPAGLWDRITASMQEAPPELRMERIRPSMVTPETLRTARTDRGEAEGASVVSLDRHRERRRRNFGLRTLVASAAAAAVVAAVIGVSVARNDHHTAPSATSHVTNPAVTTASVAMREVRQALREKGSRRIVLRPLVGGGASLDAVVTPSGTSYLYDPQLTELGADRTYQLWGVVGNERVSYGLLGADPHGVIPFKAGTGVSGLAVTNEKASGAVVTKQPVVVAGEVNPAL